MHIANSSNLFLPPNHLKAWLKLFQMKLQDLVDQGKINNESAPQNLLNRKRIIPDLEISISGILKLLNNLKPGKAAGLDSIRPILP